MKRYLLGVIFAAFVLVLLGCGQETAMSPETTDIAEATLAKAAIGTTPVFDFSLNEVGSSKLVRNKNGLTMNLQTSGLQKGDAITIWWGIFNNPENCATSPCGVPDLFDAATGPDLLYATGHVVGGSGKGNFAAHLSKGDNTGSILPQPSAGLTNPEGAEVHLVVRTHGPAIPGQVDEQIRSFNGGCPPNTCEDIQFAIHQP